MSTRRRSVTLCASLFLAGILSTATSVGAQTISHEEAQTRFHEGLVLYDKGEFEAARVKFTEAYAVLRSSTILFNLARTEQYLAHPIEALNDFREFMSDPDPAKSPDGVRDAPIAIAELEKRVGRITIDAPDGARISVDGKAFRGVAPVADPVYVTASVPHVVAAEFGEGSSLREKTVTLSAPAGESVTAHLRFDPEEPLPASGLDAQPSGAAPRTSPQPTLDARPRAAETSSTRTALTAASLIVAGAGLATGFVFMADARSQADDLNAYQTSHPGSCVNLSSQECSQAQALKDDHDRSVTIMTVSFVVAGISAASAAAFLFLWPSTSRAPTHAWLAPAVGAHGGGLQLGGSF